MFSCGSKCSGVAWLGLGFGFGLGSGLGLGLGLGLVTLTLTLTRVEVQRRRLPARPHVADRVARLRPPEAGREPRGHGVRRRRAREVVEQLGQHLGHGQPRAVPGDEGEVRVK